MNEKECVSIAVGSYYITKYGVPIDVLEIIIKFVMAPERIPLTNSRYYKSQKSYLLTDDDIRRFGASFDLIQSDLSLYRHIDIPPNDSTMKPSLLGTLFDKPESGEWYHCSHRKNFTIRPSSKSWPNPTSREIISPFFYYSPVKRPTSDHVLIFVKQTTSFKPYVTVYISSYWILRDMCPSDFCRKILDLLLIENRKLYFFEEVRNDKKRIDKLDLHVPFTQTDVSFGDIILFSLIVPDVPCIEGTYLL